tara:strand:+ start:7581 stop:7994 length:414 start_codon:yes stop_codon:yes gene_type:complete
MGSSMLFWKQSGCFEILSILVPVLSPNLYFLDDLQLKHGSMHFFVHVGLMSLLHQSPPFLKILLQHFPVCLVVSGKSVLLHTHVVSQQGAVCCFSRVAGATQLASVLDGCDKLKYPTEHSMQPSTRQIIIDPINLEI